MKEVHIGSANSDVGDHLTSNKMIIFSQRHYHRTYEKDDYDVADHHATKDYGL